MTRFAPLLALPLLAACHVDAKHPRDGDDNVAMSADAGGNFAFNLPFAKGQVKLPGAMMQHGSIDIDGVKMIPGGTVTGFAMTSQGGKSNVDIGFSAPGAPDAVRSYFADQFAKKGVKAAVSGDTLSGKTEDGKPFTITTAAAAAGAGTTGTIRVVSDD